MLARFILYMSSVFTVLSTVSLQFMVFLGPIVNKSFSRSFLQCCLCLLIKRFCVLFLFIASNLYYRAKSWHTFYGDRFISVVGKSFPHVDSAQVKFEVPPGFHLFSLPSILEGLFSLNSYCFSTNGIKVDYVLVYNFYMQDYAVILIRLHIFIV